jgi:hypothetical protein
MNEKKTKENNKKTTAKKAFWAKKDKCDEIRKRPQEMWSINNIQTLLTYKKLKNDVVIKKTRANRDAMLAEYDRRSNRLTPPCSPIVEINEDISDEISTTHTLDLDGEIAEM